MLPVGCPAAAENIKVHAWRETCHHVLPISCRSYVLVMSGNGTAGSANDVDKSIGHLRRRKKHYELQLSHLRFENDGFSICISTVGYATGAARV